MIVEFIRLQTQECPVVVCFVAVAGLLGAAGFSSGLASRRRKNVEQLQLEYFADQFACPFPSVSTGH